MIIEKSQRNSWVDVVPIVLAFSGAMVSIVAAIGFYTSQAEVASGSMWPLPGLVLLEWALLGAGGFIAAYFCLYKGASQWLGNLWAISGALIPLIIVGAFSIGPLVLIVFLIFLACAVILTVRKGATVLTSLGMFFMGGIVNALVLFAIIFAANPGLFNQ